MNTIGAPPTIATGAKSFSESYCGFATSRLYSACVDAVPKSSVWPSGVARITSSEPIAPLAPALFSTTTDWPSAAPSATAYWRAKTSVGPPGGNGTTSRIGRDGNALCASASGSWPPAARLRQA